MSPIVSLVTLAALVLVVGFTRSMACMAVDRGCESEGCGKMLAWFTLAVFWFLGMLLSILKASHIILSAIDP